MGYFPSHGAKSLFVLSADIEALAAPIVDTEDGRDLVRMAQEGPGLISPNNVKGLIAFPSYHAVLAFTAAYSMRGVRGLFPVYLILNVLVIIASPLHGGHHLVDVFAGFAVFVFGTMMAGRLVRSMYFQNDHSDYLETDIPASLQPA